MVQEHKDIYKRKHTKKKSNKALKLIQSARGATGKCKEFEQAFFLPEFGIL